MCGICGIIWNDKDRPADEAGVRRMMDCLARRGPDGSGVWLGAGGKRVALGHRRLAVIDLATGDQPMVSPDGGVALVYNGEIFNFRELRGELESRGKTFRTHSDTEVLLRVFEDERERTPASLDGQFAFAAWDTRDHSLTLARDRLGEKPLFYAELPDRFVFASTLEALQAGLRGKSGDSPNSDKMGTVPIFPSSPSFREIDPEALDAYLALGYIPAPRTIFRGVRKLPPASTLVWKDGVTTVRRYWSLAAGSRPSADESASIVAGVNVDEVLRKTLRNRLTDAVRSRLVADVPLGAFLSGGIDSSLIVALMAEAATERVRTFSIEFGDPLYNETEFARAVAARYGTEHREFRVEPKAAEALAELVRAFGEPFADSSAIPTWYLARETRGAVTVALSGDGGDELFGGYDRYRALMLAGWLDRRPKFLRAMLRALAARFAAGSPEQRSGRRRAERFAAALEADPVGRYVAWMSLFDAPARETLLTGELRAARGEFRGEDYLRQKWGQSLNGTKAGTVPISLAERAMATDVETYLPGDLLVKTDVASMNCGLEVRCPFLDHRLVEFASRVPASLKLSAFTGKRILRDAFRDKLPHKIRRRKKMGFGVPLGKWFRGELKGMLEDTLLSPRAATRDALNPEAVRALVDEHQSERADHGQRLYALLFLELWMREFARK